MLTCEQLRVRMKIVTLTRDPMVLVPLGCPKRILLSFGLPVLGFHFKYLVIHGPDILFPGFLGK